MTPQPDFKTLLSLLCIANNPKTSKTGEEYRQMRDDLLLEWVEINGETIRTALLIADALMQEPSEEAIEAGLAVYNKIGCGCEDCEKSFIQQQFEAMRDQCLKGIL